MSSIIHTIIVYKQKLEADDEPFVLLIYRTAKVNIIAHTPHTAKNSINPFFICSLIYLHKIQWRFGDTHHKHLYLQV